MFSAALTCVDSEFQCSSGECIPGHWVCDDYDDCPDNSDQIGCGKWYNTLYWNIAWSAAVKKWQEITS